MSRELQEYESLTAFVKIEEEKDIQIEEGDKAMKNGDLCRQLAIYIFLLDTLSNYISRYELCKPNKKVLNVPFKNRQIVLLKELPCCELKLWQTKSIDLFYFIIISIYKVTS